MDTFLIDGSVTYSYQRLFDEINQASYYCPCYKSDDLYGYFRNLVIALLTNQPLMLLDSDLNLSEVGGVKEDDINVLKKIEIHHLTCIEEIIKKVQISNSEITIFTSGTTGQPKKVIHSVNTLTRSVRIAEKYSRHIWGFAYNPTHMAGLQVFFQAFENQNTLVNFFGVNRCEIYQLIRSNGITHLSATPTFYRLLLPVTDSFETLERITLGGEKSNQNLYDSILKIFPNAKINNIYASTEAGSLFASKGECFQIPQRIKDKFMVENEELLIHKSLLGESDSFTFINDYYHTGDLIEWVNREDGLFRFKSRKNELINVGGYKVNPNEIESCIQNLEGVEQVIVYGRSNSILGNILCADIKKDPLSMLTEQEIRQYLKTQLQDFKIPRKVQFVENLALTRTGKIKRS